MLLPRLEQGWKVFPALTESIPESPSEQVKKLYFDTLVFDPAALTYLVGAFGTQGLMLGTDYPFNFHERRPVERLVSAGLDRATCDALAFGNARRFLGNKHMPQKESS